MCSHHRTPNDVNRDLLFQQYQLNNSIDLNGFTKLMRTVFEDKTTKNLTSPPYSPSKSPSLPLTVPSSPSTSSSQSQSTNYPSMSHIKTLFELFDRNKNGSISAEEFNWMWDEWLSTIVLPRSALIIIDAQNDFISGSLAMNKLPAGQNAEQIIPIINKLIDEILWSFIVYSLDYHPDNHISFVENVHLRKVLAINGKPLTGNQQIVVKPFDRVTFLSGNKKREQIVFPKHCIKSTWGSQLHANLKVGASSIKIHKGCDPEIDSYSAFKDNDGENMTELHDQLKSHHITDIYICGLAYDVCVYYTILDSLALGYRTILIEDASRGTDITKIVEAKKTLKQLGCVIVDSSQVKPMVTCVARSFNLAYFSAIRLLEKLIVGN